jgi:hypothetical protein
MSTGDPNWVLTTLRNGHLDYPAASATEVRTLQSASREVPEQKAAIGSGDQTALSAIFIDPPIVTEVCGPLVAIADVPEGVEASPTPG